MLSRLGRSRGFTLLLPSLEPRRGYLLVLDAANWNHEDANLYAARLDSELQHNPQYRHARRLGQLDGLRPLRVESPWRRYAEYRHAEGKTLGDIKPPVLSADVGISPRDRESANCARSS